MERIEKKMNGEVHQQQITHTIHFIEIFWFDFRNSPGKNKKVEETGKRWKNGEEGGVARGLKSQ